MSPSPTDQTALQLRGPQVKANFKQGALPGEEFPQALRLEEGEELLTLDCELLKEIIEQVTFAATVNTGHPVLEGVCMACQNGFATFRAADAFRLAVRTIPIADQRITAELLIPATTLRTLARLLPSSGAVRLGRSRDGQQLLVHTREMDLSSRLLAGAFPNISTLLNLETRTSVVLPTSDLANAVHLMAAFARENRHQLRCTVEASGLLLEAEAPDLGANEMRLTEAVTVSGPAVTFMVNHTYLAEALAAVPTSQVTVACLDARRPVTLKPVGPLDAQHVIMPLLLEAPSARTQTAPEAPAASAAS
jgi:DNA polymerase-3 subunit beta